MTKNFAILFFLMWQLAAYILKLIYKQLRFRKMSILSCNNFFYIKLKKKLSIEFNFAPEKKFIKIKKKYNFFLL